MNELTPLRRNRDFLLLQAGQLLSTFGAAMSAIAYPLLALALTGSAAKAGYVGAIQFAPVVLLGPAAGVAADRFDRRKLMIASDVAGGGDAAISPSGRYMAVASRRSGSVDIWLYDLRKGTWSQITRDAGDEFGGEI